MPTVSVVMPTYNRAWVIERAIGSVLAQTAGDLELIVVDDGSTDDTGDLLDRIADPRLVRLTCPRRGSAAARNAGLGVARGDLIAYLDTDNVWHPDFLAVMTEELPATHVMAYCSQHLFLVDGTRDAPRIIGRKVRSTPYNPDAMTRGSFIDTNCVLHRRSVLAEVGGFDEGLAHLVDWDLFARIAIRHPFGVRHVDHVLCDYHLYLRRTAPTITNGFVGDDDLLAAFGFETDETGKRIRAKVDALLGRSGALEAAGG